MVIPTIFLLTINCKKKISYIFNIPWRLKKKIIKCFAKVRLSDSKIIKDKTFFAIDSLTKNNRG